MGIAGSLRACPCILVTRRAIVGGEEGYMQMPNGFDLDDEE